MSVKLIKSPFDETFKAIVSRVERELVFSSPYINDKGALVLLNAIENTMDKRVSILTNLSARNIVDNVTQPSALLTIHTAFKETTISSLAKLHAKVYIVDESAAIITSANLTYGGLKSNFEYGVIIDDKETIKTIKQDILDYTALGHIFDRAFIEKLNIESKKIERIQKTQQDTAELKYILDQKTAEPAKKIDAIFTSHYENRDTRHSIFTKTVKFLLQKYKHLTIQELYALVHDIHPELCNDTIIYHNEKRWKIEIRQALFFWKRKGIVASQGNLRHYTWSLLV